MLGALTVNSGLDAYLDATISVDAAGKFKPHPDCYALVEANLGVAKEEVLFVSSNGFDVAGAKHFGFKVAWIKRAAPAAPGGPVTPAGMFRLLRGREETLGYLQDHAVGSLTDLTTLL